HHAGLDGLRGLAVAAVVGYHLGLGWLKGGFLGVSLFFTLSGFLITNLLLAEAGATDGIGLRRFWGRRARRLLPAAFGGILLALVATAAVGTADQMRNLPGDVLGAVAYVANWRFVLSHSAYQAGYAAPSPLLHYWSLAIEEQLYLVLPLLVAVVGWRSRQRFRRRSGKRAGAPGRRALATVVTLLLIASAAATLVLGGGDPNRVYFGTDTRMFELLAGVLLAVVAGFPTSSSRSSRRRSLVNVAGLTVLATTLVGWGAISEKDHWLYRGGLWGVAVVSCALISVALRPGVVAGVLRWRPLAALGRVSYGVYVYHWPLFVLLDSQHTGLRGVWLGLVRLCATGVVAGASYRFLEQPIRQRRWPRRTVRPALVLASVMIVVLVIGSVVIAGRASSRAVAAVARHPIVLAAAADQGEAAQGSSTTPAPVALSPPKLGKVLFVGDSLMQQPFPTFAARLAEQGIEARSLGGPGQSLMSHHAAWLPELQQDVATFDPDVIVLESCCGNFVTDPVWVGPDGRPVPRDTPAFYAEWRRLATDASTIASSRGAAVLWVVGPPVHTNGFYGPIDGWMPQVDAIYLSLASCAPGVGILDWRVVSGPDGRYAASLADSTGRLVPIRMPDGFHFTPAGWDLLSNLTLSSIDREWRLDGGRPGAWNGTCAQARTGGRT
ncbi:MAG TPA: acyltransferase family protein, partial [Acidimicrobiales bacterium]|nr:acyltransferase family protein [Acidimicrobiales bacterium]